MGKLRGVTSSKVAFALFFILISLSVSLPLLFGFSPNQASTLANFQVPFEGMQLAYYSETTPILQQRTGLAGNGWTTFLFHNLTSTSSMMDIAANGTVTQGNNQSPIQLASTVAFPTNEDTLLFLRNGGQQNLTLYASDVAPALQKIPNYNVQLTGLWNLQEQTPLKTALGIFSTYKYHRQVALGNTTLEFYASYDQSKQLLIYGEVYATQSGLTALIETTELREINQELPSSAGNAPKCVIATAAYGSELAGPVQFLRGFRDGEVNETYLGRSFLTAFNAWYYSWAPSVAKEEYVDGYLRSSVQIAILPLLGSLMIASAIFQLIHPVNPELAVLATGLVASALLGLIYLTPLIFAIVKLKKVRLTRRSLFSVALFGFILTMLGTLGHGSYGILEILPALLVIEITILTPLTIVKVFSRRKAC